MIIEIILSIILTLVLLMIPSEFIQSGWNQRDLAVLVGGDALTLMGFIIQALAIIGALVDRKVLDGVRKHPSFSDLWNAFVVAAITLGTQGLFGRIVFVYAVPDSFYILGLFLGIFNIMIIGSCVILLAKFISAINEGLGEEQKDVQDREISIPSDISPEQQEDTEDIEAVKE